MNTSVDVEAIHRQFDWSRTPPTCAVIDAIAALEGVEATRLPERLDTTLSDHVDPEALDTFVSGDTCLGISFTYEEYSVRIDDSTLHVSQ